MNYLLLTESRRRPGFIAIVPAECQSNGEIEGLSMIPESEEGLSVNAYPIFYDQF